MKTKNIIQTVTFDASPKAIFQALLDEKQHAEFTGSAAFIDQSINGKFSVYDGYCHGYNIALTKDKKIIQAWHFEEDGWPDDHFSVCTFLLEEKGMKTKLTFTQTDIPENKIASLSSGWKTYYWKPLKDFLKAANNKK